jgi:hypothetical protein
LSMPRPQHLSAYQKFRAALKSTVGGFARLVADDTSGRPSPRQTWAAGSAARLNLMLPAGRWSHCREGPGNAAASAIGYNDPANAWPRCGGAQANCPGPASPNSLCQPSPPHGAGSRVSCNRVLRVAAAFWQQTGGAVKTKTSRWRRLTRGGAFSRVGDQGSSRFRFPLAQKSRPDGRLVADLREAIQLSLGQLFLRRLGGWVGIRSWGPLRDEPSKCDGHQSGSGGP